MQLVTLEVQVVQLSCVTAHRWRDPPRAAHAPRLGEDRMDSEVLKVATWPGPRDRSSE